MLAQKSTPSLHPLAWLLCLTWSALTLVLNCSAHKAGKCNGYWLELKIFPLTGHRVSDSDCRYQLKSRWDDETPDASKPWLNNNGQHTYGTFPVRNQSYKLPDNHSRAGYTNCYLIDKDEACPHGEAANKEAENWFQIDPEHNGATLGIFCMFLVSFSKDLGSDLLPNNKRPGTTVDWHDAGKHRDHLCELEYNVLAPVNAYWLTSYPPGTKLVEDECPYELQSAPVDPQGYPVLQKSPQLGSTSSTLCRYIKADPRCKVDPLIRPNDYFQVTGPDGTPQLGIFCVLYYDVSNPRSPSPPIDAYSGTTDQSQYFPIWKYDVSSSSWIQGTSGYMGEADTPYVYPA
ncbi:hypothetical protein BCR37DRAFT_395319 [Protomyces lactucae-debilis]|uniref:Uncharacterized protein n=1 Tax=Protomyces lactucae-debilis TaxID=2754530 RepID=A0A1Y2EXP5_PROLT|nr:uncharacterized protein BCR37DRAFT_395319 [Protomyces lactucae-debilis]ORY76391.1 hypothetical protein BCR37DRAFT_395319 [Protomyces lactucae-debilis]